MISPPFARLDWDSGNLDGPEVCRSEKRIRDLQSIFLDRESWSALDPDTLVYSVWWRGAVPAGTEGGLFWGGTEIRAGKVGGEYFMTRGHRHSIPNRAEFYATVQGTGILLLRDAAGNIRAEQMARGSLHYIGADTAHRVVNTGATPLRFIACWPSDAGHDYTIAETGGFGARVVEENGHPRIVVSAGSHA